MDRQTGPLNGFRVLELGNLIARCFFPCLLQLHLPVVHHKLIVMHQAQNLVLVRLLLLQVQDNYLLPFQSFHNNMF